MQYYIIRSNIIKNNKPVYVIYTGSMIDFGLTKYSTGCIYRNNAIKISEEILLCNMIQIYLAYNDCILEKINLQKESKRNIFHTITDYGNNNMFQKYYDYYKTKYNRDYVIAPSEHNYINGYYNNSLFYKILINVDEKQYWLNDKLQIDEDINSAIIISECCMGNSKIIKYLRQLEYNYSFYFINQPCHYSNIFYSYEDINVFFSNIK